MRDLRLILIALCAFAAGLGQADAQEHIGSTAVAHNDVTRDLAGAMAPLTVGDSVYRNEVVRTGADSTAKLVFLDSTNLGVGPISRVTLDQFVYVGESNGQKMTVNLAKGVFRFTTGKLDKNAYTISTPNAAIGVRGTVLDIRVQGALSRVTLVEGQALVCPRRAGITFEQQARNCTRAAGGSGGPRCECIDMTNVGQTAQVKKAGGANQASLTATPVSFASLCAGDSSLCSGSSYASADQSGGFASGVLCGR
ncbi:MAG: FecR family protein [Roseiarcus sp.]